MPEVFDHLLKPNEIADLVAYLKEAKGPVDTVSSEDIPPHHAIELPGLHAYAQKTIAAGEEIEFGVSSSVPTICRWLSWEPIRRTATRILCYNPFRSNSRKPNPFIPVPTCDQYLDKALPAGKLVGVDLGVLGPPVSVVRLAGLAYPTRLSRALWLRVVPKRREDRIWNRLRGGLRCGRL